MLTTNCTINFGKQITPPIVQAVQGDSGRAVNFTLSDITIPDGATATYYVQKPSGEAVYNNATISGNNVIVEFTPQALAEYGECPSHVRILSDGEVVTSFAFILLVRKFFGDGAIESTTEMNIFDKAVEQATEQIRDSADEVAQEVIASIPADYTALSTEVTDLKADLSDNNISKDITLNGESCHNINLTWEQGAFTSTNPSQDSAYDVRTGYFQDGGYIFNPGGKLNFAVGYFLTHGTWDRYIAGGVPGASTNFFKDEVFYLPPLKAGYYRIRACNYVGTTKQLITPDKCNIIMCATNKIAFWLCGQIETTGFSAHSYSIVSQFISDCNYIKIKRNDSNAKFSVYSTVDESSYTSITGGFLTDNNYILPVEKGKKYVVRVGEVESPVTSIENYSTYTGSLEVTESDSLFGYVRDYDDITHLLTFERKSITSQGISDSTIDIIAKLPNNGNVEVKMNAPMGKFAVYKVASGGTISPMTDGWSHYQFRYTGDYTSSYYARVRYEADGAILPEVGAQILRVYMYSDFGHKNDLCTALFGKNIAFFGDSIVQGRFAKNNGSVNLCMAKPYSVLISEIIGDLTPINYGIGGATVYDSDWKSLYRNVGNVKEYDVVFVCAGTNDYANNVSSENFTSAFDYVITQLLANNASVIVCTPTARRTMTANTAGLTLQDYANIEKTIAANNNLKVIDLLSITNNAVFLNTLPDGLHPNEIGHGMLANAIIDNYDLT